MATTDSHKAATNSLQFESRLLALPAEVRNEILRLVLIQRETVPVGSTTQPHDGHTAGWPDIADTCKQLRAEALPVFFGNNNFVIKWDVVCKSLHYIDAWLQRFKKAPLSVKRLIKSLEIDIAEGMVAVERTQHWMRRRVFENRTYAPRFRRCSTFLSYLSDAGLMAQQLVWPGAHRHAMSDLLKRGRLGLLNSKEGEVWARARLFNPFVLSPLLRQHGLYDEARPPLDVVRQFEEESEGTDLEGGAISLKYSGNSWMSCVPANWYWAWLDGEEG